MGRKPPTVKKTDPEYTLIEIAFCLDVRGCVCSWFSDTIDSLQFVNIPYLMSTGGKEVAKHVKNIRMSCVRHEGKSVVPYPFNRDSAFHNPTGGLVCDQTYIDFEKLPANFGCRFIGHRLECYSTDYDCRENSSRCYGRMLQAAREKLSWTEGSFRSVVVVGDASMEDCPEKEWKMEVDRIKNELVRRVELCSDDSRLFFIRHSRYPQSKPSKRTVKPRYTANFRTKLFLAVFWQNCISVIQ